MAETLPVTDMLPNRFEPLQKRRFVLAIEGIDAYMVKSAARPSYSTEEIQVNWINNTRYLAGKTTFETIEVTLHDAINPSGAQQVMEWIRLIWESISGRGGYADFYKRDVQIKMLDPVGTVVQLWDLKGCFPTSAQFNDVSYDSTADLAEITLTLRYDQVTLQF